jgi:TPR repeat protein
MVTSAQVQAAEEVRHFTKAPFTDEQIKTLCPAFSTPHNREACRALKYVSLGMCDDVSAKETNKQCKSLATSSTLLDEFLLDLKRFYQDRDANACASDPSKYMSGIHPLYSYLQANRYYYGLCIEQSFYEGFESMEDSFRPEYIFDTKDPNIVRAEAMRVASLFMKKYLMNNSYDELDHVQDLNFDSYFTFIDTTITHGSILAIPEFGQAFEYGLGTDKDLAKAIELYNRGYEFKLPDAAFNLARIYQDGNELVDINKTLAMKYYKDAAKWGSEAALARLKQKLTEQKLSYFKMLKAALLDNNHNKAISIFQKVEALDFVKPESFWYRYAVSLQKSGNKEQASLYAKKYIELSKKQKYLKDALKLVIN